MLYVELFTLIGICFALSFIEKVRKEDESKKGEKEGYEVMFSR